VIAETAEEEVMIVEAEEVMIAETIVVIIAAVV